MYAIIRTGGKQAKVSAGDVIDVERLRVDGDEVEFTPILVVDDDGNTVTDRDALAGMAVKAKVVGEVKGPKIDIFKYKAKTGYRRRQGHRQRYTRLEILEIAGATKKKAAKATAKKAADTAKNDTAAPAEDAAADDQGS